MILDEVLAKNSMSSERKQGIIFSNGVSVEILREVKSLQRYIFSNSKVGRVKLA